MRKRDALSSKPKPQHPNIAHEPFHSPKTHEFATSDAPLDHGRRDLPFCGLGFRVSGSALLGTHHVPVRRLFIHLKLLLKFEWGLWDVGWGELGTSDLGLHTGLERASN